MEEEKIEIIGIVPLHCLCCGDCFCVSHVSAEAVAEYAGREMFAQGLCERCQERYDAGEKLISIVDKDLCGKTIQEAFRVGTYSMPLDDYESMMELFDNADTWREFEKKNHYIILDYRMAEQLGFPVQDYIEHRQKQFN